MNKRVFVLIGLLVAGVAYSDETLSELSWSQLQQSGQVKGGQILPADSQTPFEHLQIESTESRRSTLPVMVIDNPGITESSYALIGQVRYEGVEGEGYLEMWNYFPNGGKYFSRTLEQRGPMRCLSGSSDWRAFLLPFYIIDGSPDRPVALELNVVLPGKGTVYLSPLRLVQYAENENPLTASALPGQWWSDQTGGLIGGIIGSVLGLTGALIGWLTSTGRGKNLVVQIMRVMFGFGVVLLLIGGAALVQSQPYGVYYPLLLIGVLCTALSASLLPTIRKRYEEIEFRKMSALDTE